MSTIPTPASRRDVVKVALVGAHGTGKTTLSRDLASRAGILGSQVTLATTPEIPRIICAAAGDNEYFRRGKNSLLKQLMLLTGQPIYETQYSRNADVLLCDRSILDHWAYTKTLFAQDLPQEIDLVLTTFIQQHLASYKLLAYVPIEFIVQDDGTREGDVSFQAAIDSFIHEFLQLHQIPFVEIRGTVEARSAELAAKIRSLL